MVWVDFALILFSSVCYGMSSDTSSTWNARTFAVGNDLSSYPASTSSIWPEYGRTNNNNNAVLFSGGGSRAMTSAIGQTRALQQFDLFNNIEYIIAVSGGGWFTSAFVYDQTPNDDTTRLCPYVDPSQLNDTFLEDIPDGCMLIAPLCDINKCLTKETIEDLPDRVWVDCIHECYLQPFDIGRDSFYTLAEDDVTDIKTRNLNLENETFLLPCPYENGNRPYMILAGTVLGPQNIQEGVAILNKTYVQFELASLGSGVSYSQTIDYVPLPKNVDDESANPIQVELSGMLEAYAFGHKAVGAGIDIDAQTQQGNGYVDVSSLGNPLDSNSLAMTAGISSMAIAANLAQNQSTVESVIKQEMWPAELGVSAYELEDDEQGNYTTMLVGDGGTLDNFGLFAALRRQLPHIVMFENSAVAINTSWDPYSRPPTNTDIDGATASFFGIEVDSKTDEGWYYFNNQVFPQEAFNPLVAALQDSIKQGIGAVVTTELTTVANDFMGIAAGIEVSIVWNYLQLATQWKDQLPSEVIDDLDKGLKGPYPYFPNYPTDMITLTSSQVNLLANMATWVMIKNQDQFEVALSL